MSALHDPSRRLLRDVTESPGKWASRLVFLLGPWVCLWMVEILNENNVFKDLAAWQVLMNMVFYYCIFIALRLILGRNRRSAAAAACLCFLFGLVNHYVLRFRGRILFPADITGWRTAANVAGGLRLLGGHIHHPGRHPAGRISGAGVLLYAPEKTGQDSRPGRGGPVGDHDLLLLRLLLYRDAPRPGHLHPAVGHPAQRIFTQLFHRSALLLGG